MIVPVVHEAMAKSGLPKDEIGFVCSGSLDYLQGGPFAFVGGLDAVGAWPPIRESHVEMDAAWALYEAWVAIQTGEVDTALVYGFGKSSPGDLHEIMALQADPYYVLPLWPSMVDMAALQASAYLEASGRTERGPRRGRGPFAAQRAGQPDRGPQGRRDGGGDPRSSRSRTIRCATPTSRRSPTARRAIVHRGRRRRPARVRTAGVDPRHRAPHRGARPRRARPHDVRVDARGRRRRREWPTARSTSPSCTRSSATRS